MKEFIILVAIVTALIAGTAATNETASTSTDDIEKPHVKIPGS